MKRFDKIAEGIFRTLLEAPPTPVGPEPAGPVGPGLAPAGLPQDGGPVAAQTPADTGADRNPNEIQTWETTLVTMCADAICRVQADPSILGPDDIKTLSSGVNLKNKDTIIDIIKTLSGKI
jgi:hypothetical protein